MGMVWAKAQDKDAPAKTGGRPPAEQIAPPGHGRQRGLGEAIVWPYTMLAIPLLVVHSRSNASIGAWLKSDGQRATTSSPTARMWPTMPPAESWCGLIQADGLPIDVWSTTRASRDADLPQDGQLRLGCGPLPR